MPIKKRGPKNEKPLNYTMMRELQWAAQPNPDKIDFRASTMANGDPLPFAVLQPRRNFFFQDIWMCPTKEEAFRVLRNIAALDDHNIAEVKLSGRWVWVKFGHSRELPGQATDDRDRVTG